MTATQHPALWGLSLCTYKLMPLWVSVPIYVFLPYLGARLEKCLNSVLNVKAPTNQKKARDFEKMFAALSLLLNCQWWQPVSGARSSAEWALMLVQAVILWTMGWIFLEWHCAVLSSVSMHSLNDGPATAFIIYHTARHALYSPATEQYTHSNRQGLKTQTYTQMWQF